MLIHCQEQATLVFQNITKFNVTSLHFIFCTLKLVYEEVNINKSAYFIKSIFEESRKNYAIQVFDHTDSEVIINVTFNNCTFLLNNGAIKVKYIEQNLPMPNNFLTRAKVVRIDNTLFQRNKNNLKGILYIENGFFFAYNNQFLNNKGSAIKAFCTHVFISFATFTNNTALNTGSSLECHTCNIAIAFANFTTNNGNDTVIVKYAYPTLISKLYLARCTFKGNHARGKGGAIYAERIQTTILEYLFYNNSANSGGAIYVVAGYYYKTYISNSTFLLNKAHNKGGALYCTNNGNILIQ